MLRDSGIQEEKRQPGEVSNLIGKNPWVVSVVGGADMVGDGNSGVLGTFPSKHYTSAFSPPDCCLPR